ncbi:TPA: hypothetical protein I8W52_003664 [Morganella morganii]|nr:hypothetical protein [Morganella morganii]
MHPNQNTLMPDLPELHHPGDAAWIQEILTQMPFRMREYAKFKYSEVFQIRSEEEPVSFRKANAGARAANRWLRLFFRKHYPAIQGYTTEPPKAQNALPGPIPNPESRQARS